MQVYQAKPDEYRPIHIVLENREDYKALLAIISLVAQNHVNCPSALIAQARDIESRLTSTDLKVS